MTRLIVGAISATGGILIGAFSGRKTSSITMKDVKAAPGKAFSSISGVVKKTGSKMASGVKSLAFWNRKSKEDAPVKETKADLEIKYQGLNEKYSNLSDDFSETVKRKDIVEADLLDTQEKLRQETEKVEAFQTSIEDNDIMLTEMGKKKKQAEVDLKLAQTEITKLKKKSAPKTV